MIIFPKRVNFLRLCQFHGKEKITRAMQKETVAMVTSKVDYGSVNRVSPVSHGKTKRGGDGNNDKREMHKPTSLLTYGDVTMLLTSCSCRQGR